MILMKEKKKISPWVKRITGVAAAFIIAAAGIAGALAYQANYAVHATVSLDVNPSIEIKLSRNERVLDVIAQNKDAEVVVGNMDFSGSSLDVTVNRAYRLHAAERIFKRAGKLYSYQC